MELSPATLGVRHEPILQISCPLYYARNAEAFQRRGVYDCFAGPIDDPVNDF